MALDCILAVRLSAAFDCLTPATTGTSRDPKTPGECHLYLAEGCHLYIALTMESRRTAILESGIYIYPNFKTFPRWSSPTQ